MLLIISILEYKYVTVHQTSMAFHTNRSNFHAFTIIRTWDLDERENIQYMILQTWLKYCEVIYSFSASNCHGRCDSTTPGIQPDRPMKGLEKDKLCYQGHLLDTAQTNRSKVIMAPNWSQHLKAMFKAPCELWDEGTVFTLCSCDACQHVGLRQFISNG